MSFQFVVYSEWLNCVAALSDKKILTEKMKGKRTLECRLLRDAYTAKILQNVINSHINCYEKKFGKIPSQVVKEDLKDPKSSSGVYTQTVFIML